MSSARSTSPTPLFIGMSTIRLTLRRMRSSSFPTAMAFWSATAVFAGFVRLSSIGLLITSGTRCASQSLEMCASRNWMWRLPDFRRWFVVLHPYLASLKAPQSISPLRFDKDSADGFCVDKQFNSYIQNCFHILKDNATSLSFVKCLEYF